MTQFYLSLRGALRCPAVAFCLVPGALAVAQTSIPPVVVTALRAEQPLTDLLADVTLIGPEEIARAGPGGLVALLQRQAGVEIVTNGGPRSTGGVFLRGANTGQTLVLVDGLRVGSSTSSSVPLEAIPLEQVERIEILRGPASSLYGADALGGVIQLFTAKGATRLRRMAARATAVTGPAAFSAASRVEGRPAGARGARLCKRGIGKATASMPSSTRRTSATTPTAMAIGTTTLAEACLFALRRSRRFRRKLFAAA
jgi:outer membrane cobalamin receptor